MQIRTEVVIDASPEVVWEILTDLDRYADWNPFIVQSQGKVEVGHRLTNTMRTDGKNMTFKPKVLAVQPGRYFDWLGSLWVKGIFDGHHYFEIEAIDEHRVTLIQGENFSGWLSGLILKQIGESTRQNFVRMNQAVKLRAEQKMKKVGA